MKMTEGCGDTGQRSVEPSKQTSVWRPSLTD